MKVTLEGVEREVVLTPEQQQLMDQITPCEHGHVFRISETMERGVFVKDFSSDEGTIRALFVEGYSIQSGVVNAG